MIKITSAIVEEHFVTCDSKENLRRHTFFSNRPICTYEIRDQISSLVRRMWAIVPTEIKECNFRNTSKQNIRNFPTALASSAKFAYISDIFKKSHNSENLD